MEPTKRTYIKGGNGRTEKVAFTATPSELAKLQRLALKAKLSLSEYLRTVVLGAKSK